MGDKKTERTREFRDFSDELLSGSGPSRDHDYRYEHPFEGRHSLVHSPKEPLPTAPNTPDEDVGENYKLQRSFSDSGTIGFALLRDGESTPIADKRVVWDRPEKRGRDEEQTVSNINFESNDKKEDRVR